jgi:hypothetical protein
LLAPRSAPSALPRLSWQAQSLQAWQATHFSVKIG